MIEKIKVDKPGKGFDGLLYALLEAGMVTSEQILLVPEDILSVIGIMGVACARILRNYAKRVVLPVLGLSGTYEEPELDINDDIGEPKITVLGYADICNEFLDLEDSDEDEEVEEESIGGDGLEDDELEISEIW